MEGFLVRGMGPYPPRVLHGRDKGAMPRERNAYEESGETRLSAYIVGSGWIVGCLLCLSIMRRAVGSQVVSERVPRVDVFLSLVSRRGGLS